MTSATTTAELAGRNRKVARWTAVAAVAMLSLAFASVPLYRLFCQATGYGGTTQRAARPADAIADRIVTIRLDANVGPGLDWTFVPVQPTVDVRIGETTLAHFRATNTGSRTLVGTATFNVAPDIAGAYFNKLECFCFTEQRLEPGQSVDMPVSFFVDPAMLKDADAARLESIVLSYTFFPVDHPKTTARSGAAERPAPAGKGT